MKTKTLTIEELDALILDAQTRRDTALRQNARHWAMVETDIIHTLCRFQTHPHITEEK